jgi:hypothetical protein
MPSADGISHRGASWLPAIVATSGRSRPLRAAGNHAVGLNTVVYARCDLTPVADVAAPVLGMRGVRTRDLEGFDAVRAGSTLSNDPFGVCARSRPTSQFEATESLAEADRVGRFVFASPCNVYGGRGNGLRDSLIGARLMTST